MGFRMASRDTELTMGSRPSGTSKMSFAKDSIMPGFLDRFLCPNDNDGGRRFWKRVENFLMPHCPASLLRASETLGFDR